MLSDLIIKFLNVTKKFKLKNTEKLLAWILLFTIFWLIIYVILGLILHLGPDELINIGSTNYTAGPGGEFTEEHYTGVWHNLADKIHDQKIRKLCFFPIAPLLATIPTTIITKIH